MEPLGVGVVEPELVARSWLLCSGELERKRPLEARKEEGGTQGSEGVTMCLLLKIFPDAI